MSSYALVPRYYRCSTPVVRRSDPFSFFSRELSRFFDDDLGSWLGTTPTRVAYPRLEVKETDEHVEVTAEVPGLAESDIELSLSAELDSLILSGQKRAETEEKQEGYFRTERSFGSFRREIALPVPVDPDQTEATLKDGLLTIRLTKSKIESKERKIEVKAAH